MGQDAPSEVKGVWLVTARSWVVEDRGAGAWERLVRGVPAPWAETILDPLAGSWYPEEALQAALASLRADLAGDDPKEFSRIVEACTRLGLSRFFRVLLRLSTPSFVLRQVPTMWRQIRRGPGRVVVDAGDRETLVAYSEFPYFADPNYVLMTLATLRELVRTTTAREPDVRALDESPTSLTVVVRHGSRL